MKNQPQEKNFPPTQPIDYTDFNTWIHHQDIIPGSIRLNNQKSAGFLHDPVKNVLIVLILITLAYAYSLTKDLHGTGISGLIKIFLPCILGFATLVAYFVSRLVFKSYAWVTTVAGIAGMMYTGILIS